MTTTFKVGDIVCHKATYLRNTGWYTNVPVNGKVVALSSGFLSVLWCDRDQDSLIHPANIILFDERHLEPN